MAPLEPKTLLIENTTKYRNTTKYLSLKSGDGPLNPAMDYDRDAPITQAFFAKVQNKMHYAVHGQTAAELKCCTTLDASAPKSPGSTPRASLRNTA